MTEIVLILTLLIYWFIALLKSLLSLEISDLVLLDIPGQILHTDVPVVHQLRHVALDVGVSPVHLERQETLSMKTK